MKGIDVSSYQNVIDWRAAKNDGVEFAILKVIRKDLQPDKMFEKNWSECEKNGILLQGVYNYSYSTTVEKANMDALAVLKILGNRKPMVWLDVEDDCQKGLGKRLIDIILAYRSKIRGAGLSFGVYTGLSFFNSYLKPYSSELKGIPFWIARYPSSAEITLKSPVNILKKPSIGQTLYGWQYSSKCKVNGIAGPVDVNEWYVKKEAKENAEPGKGRYTYEPVKYGDSGTHVQLLQQTLLNRRFKTCVINGKKKTLVADGKAGIITITILKRYQGYVGLPQTGICDEATWKKLLYN